MLVLLEHLFDLGFLGVVILEPSLVLEFDDVVEGDVLGELAVHPLEVLDVPLEEFQETLHLEFVPPIVLLECGEDASEDVSHIGSTSNVGGERSIEYDHEDSPGMIEHDVEILHGLNGILYRLHVDTDLRADLRPRGLNVLHLIDVEGT